MHQHTSTTDAAGGQNHKYSDHPVPHYGNCGFAPEPCQQCDGGICLCRLEPALYKTKLRSCTLPFKTPKLRILYFSKPCAGLPVPCKLLVFFEGP